MSSSELKSNIDEYLEPAERERRILKAVEENDISSLKTLLNSPEWYKVKILLNYPEWYKILQDEEGLPLPAIAAVKDCEDVFNYLLSLPNYPQETLDAALLMYINLALPVINSLKECYARKLIERGADVHQPGLLHRALLTNWLEVAECLLKKGADVNQADGDDAETPLDICWKYIDEDIDPNEHVVAMLMFYGADPITRYRGEFFDEAEKSSFDVLLNQAFSMNSYVENCYKNYIFGIYTDYDLNVH